MKKLCRYYPCHTMDDLHCDLCWCIFYPCLDATKGKMLMNGWWDCSKCTIIHEKEFIDILMEWRKPYVKSSCDGW